MRTRRRCHDMWYFRIKWTNHELQGPDIFSTLRGTIAASKLSIGHTAIWTCRRRKLKRMGRVSVLSVPLLGNQPKGLSRIEMQIRRRLVLVPSMALRQKAGRTLTLLKHIMPFLSSACLPKAKISETRWKFSLHQCFVCLTWSCSAMEKLPKKKKIILPRQPVPAETFALRRLIVWGCLYSQ